MSSNQYFHFCLDPLQLNNLAQVTRLFYENNSQGCSSLGVVCKVLYNCYITLCYSTCLLFLTDDEVTNLHDMSMASDEGLDVSQRFMETIFTGPELDADSEEVITGQSWIVVLCNLLCELLLCSL